MAQRAAAVNKTLLIVFFSRTNGTRQMAEAAAAVNEPGVAIRLLTAEQATADDLLRADGVIFATPETLAAIAGPMKDFFDRAYYPALGGIEGRPYAIMICAGSDGANACRQIQRIATGWRLRLIAPPLIVCTRAQTPDAILAPKQIGLADLARCAELGAGFAAGIAAGVF